MNVVLISRDHRLGAILTMALSAPEQLTLLDSATEVPDRQEAEIDAVVLDLPADSRRDAYDKLRQRYEGRVVVPVDNARDTSGWPPDAKRRFLVRPFQVADLIAGVQEPQETSVAERAAKYRRRFRWNRHQAPAFPLAAVPPDAGEPMAAPPPAAATPLPTAEESTADQPAAARPEPAPEELAATGEVEATGEADDGPATVEFVMDEQEEAEATAEKVELTAAEDEAELTAAEDEAATGETTAEDHPEAEDGDQAQAGAEAEQDLEETLAAGEAKEDDGEAEAGEAKEDDGEAEAKEVAAAGSEQDDEEAEAGTEEDHGAVRELDEALIAELEELVLADSGEGGEAPAEHLPEALEGVPAQEGPSAPPLPVRAGVAMAEAVALQQWLETEELKRARQRRRLVLANVVAGLVLLLVGVVLGRAIGPDQPQQASTPTTPSQPAKVRSAPAPAACTAAMDNADQVISYLVAKIRDERLSKSIQEYGANARACRTTGR
jgi:hypothetical protein